MKTLVLSDIHGNLPALEKLIKSEKADFYVSLGDVVNYGPWSNECVDLLETLPCVPLIGNHETFYIFGECDIAGMALKFFNFCYPDFKKIDIIRCYLESYETNEFCFKHSFGDETIYPDSEVEFKRNYIIGHAHHPSTHYCENHKMFVVGSVGQNRRFINRIDYAIVEGRECKLKSLLYDESLILNEMKARNYPHELIDYYNRKERCITLS